MKAMEVQLTADQKALVRREQRERTRAEILAAVDKAEASLAAGEGRIITQQSMRDLAGEVKQRGRERLAAEQTPARERSADQCFNPA